MLQLIVIPAAALLLSGCQMLAQRAAPSPVTRIVVLEKGKVVSDTANPPVWSDSFAALGGDLVLVPRSKIPGGTLPPVMPGLSKGEIERDIARFSQLSKAKGGPTFSLLPEPCGPEFERRVKASKTKKAVCYTTEDSAAVPFGTE